MDIEDHDNDMWVDSIINIITFEILKGVIHLYLFLLFSIGKDTNKTNDKFEYEFDITNVNQILNYFWNISRLLGAYKVIRFLPLI